MSHPHPPFDHLKDHHLTACLHAHDIMHEIHVNIVQAWVVLAKDRVFISFVSL